MRVYSLYLIALISASLAGCRSIPFEDITRVSMTGQDPVHVRLTFEKRLIRTFESQDALVFSFMGRTMSALGIVAVDEPVGTFAVVCMSHTGMKILDVRGNGKTVTTVFSLPEFKERGDIGKVVGQDIRHAYFNRVPAANAEALLKRTSILYRNQDRDEWIFAGNPALLVEKRIRTDGRHVCTVRYYNYCETPNGIRPMGIVIDNHRYKYRLIVRATEEFGRFTEK